MNPITEWLQGKTVYLDPKNRKCYSEERIDEDEWEVTECGSFDIFLHFIKDDAEIFRNQMKDSIDSVWGDNNEY